MPVKMIAVDMDGTFLDDKKRYNRERFLKQYEALKKRNIHFVVASGNQYYQLASFFPEIVNEISFVAENGAWVLSEGQELFSGELSHADYLTVLKQLQTRPEIKMAICGKYSAYTLNSFDADYVKQITHYYARFDKVDRFEDVNDAIFKFALHVPDALTDQLLEELTPAIKGLMVPTSSGHGFIDLIIPGLHKANGLRILQKKWGINDNEVLCFGDGGNDLEMLAQSGYSFAMDNAPIKVKNTAKYQAGHNNHEAVLDVIDKVINNQTPFDA